GLLDGDAPGLSATSSEFAENVTYRDCAHLGPRDPGDLEHRHAARGLYLDIDLFFVKLARAQLLAETVARRSAGIGAHQRIEHTLLCGEVRARRHVFALALPGLGDSVFHEITHDLFNVASHVAALGELGRLHLDERGTRQPGEPARDLGLAYAGWSNHQDVLGHDLFAQLLVELEPAPAIAQRDCDGAFGIALADDEPVKFRDDFARRKIGHLESFTRAASRW